MQIIQKDFETITNKNDERSQQIRMYNNNGFRDNYMVANSMVCNRVNHKILEMRLKNTYIIEICARAHNLHPSDLHISAGKSTDKVRARNHAMWIMRRKKHMIFRQIAEIFGYMDSSKIGSGHTGAIHGVKTHEGELHVKDKYVVEKHEEVLRQIESIQRESKQESVNEYIYL